jgi:hypothetical protein
MKTPASAEQREHILKRLRRATVYQIGLWDTASELAEMTNRELGDVLESIMHLGITADTGMELDVADLDDWLDPGSFRIKSGKPLSEGYIQ